MNRSWIHQKIVERSFNSDTFLAFVKELKDKTPYKFLLMLNNASIHKTKKVKEYFAANDIELAFNVPY